MTMAEHEAARRGCHGACVNTYDFAVPGFYLGLGYRVVLELADYPVGHRTLVLTQSLVRD